jgi:hypothetical protein
LYIEQQGAWCHQCRAFGSAEIIPLVEELHERIQEIETPTQKNIALNRSEAATRRELRVLRMRLKWRQSRESSARCLKCGSTDIEPICFGDDDDTCVAGGQRLTLTNRLYGHADTAFDWIAEYSPEGIAVQSTH